MVRVRWPHRRTLVTAIILWVLLLAALPGLAQSDAIVSTVNGETITRTEFHARVRLVRWQYLHQISTLYDLTGGNLGLAPTYVLSLVDSLQDPVGLGDAVLAEMETERLLWQTGAELDALPTAEDAQEHEAAFFSLWTNVPVAELDTDAEAQAFITNWYAEAEAASGLSHDAIQRLFATEALRTRLFSRLADSVPAEELAVRSRHILCSFHPDDLADRTPPTDEQRDAAQLCIRTAQARLATGDSFEDVAADLSDDSGSAASGGDIGWVLLSNLTENYAEAVRDAELNTIIGPVETEFGLHLIEVQDRRMQELTADEYEASQRGYFDLWLQVLRDEATIERAADWADGVPDEPALASLDESIRTAIAGLQAG